MAAERQINRSERPLPPDELTEQTKHLLRDYLAELSRSPEFKDALQAAFFGDPYRERKDLEKGQILIERANFDKWTLSYTWKRKYGILEQEQELVLTKYPATGSKRSWNEHCEKVTIHLASENMETVTTVGVSYQVEAWYEERNRKPFIYNAVTIRNSNLAISEADRFLDDFRTAGSQKEEKEYHPEGLTNAQEDLCSQLFETGAIKFGAYKMKVHDKYPEAPLSPIYIDLRIIRRFPEAKAAAVSAYEEMVSHLTFGLLADVPTAATPIVSSLSDRLKVGMITPRVGVKTHGSGAKIDGLMAADKGKTVVVIDDLVTGADSKMEAINILLENGLIIKDVVVLIDREQGGREQLAVKRYTLHSALTMDQMLRYYKRTEMISDEIYQDIVQRLQTLNQFLGLNKTD